MAKNNTNINTPEDEKKLSEIKSALANSALGGLQQEETILSKSKTGAPVARKRISKSKPDPKAALAYLQFLNKTEDHVGKNNKFFQITADERILLSTSKLAEVMGVSIKTIGVWEQKGLTKEKRGWWDIAKAIAWRNGQNGPSVIAERMEAETRLKMAKAAIAEAELRQKNGELIPLSIVDERLGELFSEIRTSVLSIGDHIMAETYTQYPELAPQARRMIDVYVTEALKNIADTGSFRYSAGQSVKKSAGRPRKRD